MDIASAGIGGGGGSSGANTALSNLTATALNASLVPGAGSEAALTLGTAALRFDQSNFATGVFIWNAAGEANPITAVLGARIEFGAGGAAAVDVVVQRTAGATLSITLGGVEVDRLATTRKLLKSTRPGIFAALADAAPAARFGGNNHIDATPVGNGADNTEDVLITYSLPAATLGLTGDRVVIESFGSFAANATLKRVRLYFGATVVFDTAAKAFNATDWRIQATVIRTGAATQIATAFFCGDTTLVAVTAQSTAPGETLSGAVTIKTTGQCTATGAANDIVNKGLVVDYLPAGA